MTIEHLPGAILDIDDYPDERGNPTPTRSHFAVLVIINDKLIVTCGVTSRPRRKTDIPLPPDTLRKPSFIVPNWCVVARQCHIAAARKYGEINKATRLRVWRELRAHLEAGAVTPHQMPCDETIAKHCPFCRS